jgi:hypothetical protein
MIVAILESRSAADQDNENVFSAIKFVFAKNVDEVMNRKIMKTDFQI